MGKSLRIYLLFLGDVILLYAALYLALFLRYWNDFRVSLYTEHLLSFTIIFIFWILVLYSLDLYNLRVAQNKLEFYKNSFTAIALSIIISVLIFYTVPFFELAPKTNLVLTSLIFLALFLLWRFFFNTTLLTLPIQTILFIGENDDSLALARFIGNNPQLGYRTKTISPNTEIGEKIVKDVDIILPVFALSAATFMTASLFERLFLRVGFFDFVEFFEKTTNTIPLDSLEHGWMLENFKRRRKAYDIIRRAFDVILSFLLLILVSPLLLLIALLVACIDGSPVVYRQERMGKNNNAFWLIKFRTMIQDAEKNGAQFASQDDKRVTPLGRVLRGWYLDELPQLWNILRGEMSFVGPRPERPEFTREFSQRIRFYNLRHLIKPGITGWAQLHYFYADSIETTKGKLSYDLYYLKNRSFILDLLIILKTSKNIVFQKGQ